MVNILIFFKALAVFVALALIGFGVYAIVVPGTSVWLLVPLLALAFGSSLISPFVYPHVRGVRSGDTVLIVFEAELPFPSFKIKSGIAESNGRKGDLIKVVLSDGSEVQARVTNYSGILTPAKAKVTEKEVEIEVR